MLFNVTSDVTHGSIKPDTKIMLHRHDFGEVFWVRKGTGLHQINSHSFAIQKGDVFMVRPERDAHTIRSSGTPVYYCNIAFPGYILKDIRKRYFPSWHFWGGMEEMPITYHMNDAEMEWADASIAELIRKTPNRLLLDRFLINLLYVIGVGQPDPYRTCPDWLRQACLTMQQPERFRLGVNGFAQLTHRSPQHIARLLKKFTGKTPLAILNTSRLEFAAGQLMNTEREIKDIAFACGYRSLSYFYARFRQAYKMPPHYYRALYSKAPGKP